MGVSRRSLLFAGAGAGATALGTGTSTAAPLPSLLPSRKTPREPRQPRAAYLRRDVANLVHADGSWHPTLYWYARAVQWMRRQPSQRSFSWLYQAYIHDTPQEAHDPSFPREWRQCPHGNRYFLPWHRWYLYYFERIVRRIIVEELGQRDQHSWALPYWNYGHRNPAGGYEGTQEWRRLPAAFRQRYLPARSGRAPEPNPLYLPFGRNGRCLGDHAMNPIDVDPSAAMREPTFEAVRAGTPNELPDSGFSAVMERYPHGAVHDSVGGQMGTVPTAAQDPVFWLHHANIDRLWYAWMARGGLMPTGWQWPAERPRSHRQQHDPPAPFVMRDENEAERVLEGPVFDFPLDAYAYESLVDGTDARAEFLSDYLVSVPRGAEEVAESERGGTLGAVQRSFTLRPMTGGRNALQQAVERGPGAGGDRVLLVIDGVRAQGSPCTSYTVHLGDDARDTDPYGPTFVGQLTFFGATQGHDHTFRFDVTDTLRAVRQGGGWSGTGPPTVRVTPTQPETVHTGATPAFARMRYAVVRQPALS